MEQDAEALSGDLDAYATDNANESWMPIYVSCLLTWIQITVFLLTLEWGRRVCPTVYDRRRLVTPHRTPPALRRKWFLDWWNIRLVTSENNSLATVPASQTRLMDAFVQQSERQVYETCPLNDPTDMMEIEQSVQSQKWVQRNRAGTWMDPSNATHSAKNHTNTGDLPELVDQSSSSVTKILSLVQEEKTEFEQVVEDERKNEVRTTGNNVLGPSENTTTTTTITGTTTEPIPSSIGGSEGSVARRRNLQGNKRADISSDNFKSQQAQRLAKLRYEQQEDRSSAWDSRIFGTVASFVMRRLLMIGDDRPAATQNTNNEENSKNAKRIDYIYHKIVRRKLSREEQELLRCVGLDTFMTLRFLKFGFDVSFWPFLVSLVTLFPVFAVGDAEGIHGYFRTTILANNNPTHLWVVLIFGYVHFSYILRRIWIEWEVFLPLRYDFLENGDFNQSKYKEQHRKTCVVEYVPRALASDKELYRFFDRIFPGQVKRAEVLLDTEYLSSLIAQRLKHIMAYEDSYAKLVHQRARYLRTKERLKKSGQIHRCCRSTIIRVSEPEQPNITVVHSVYGDELKNVFFSTRKVVKDARTYKVLPWHAYMIRKLNKDIEDEYTRLAIAQRRPLPTKKRNSFTKRLRLWFSGHYDTEGAVQTKTAFVEFHTVVSKEQAIQCNMSGLYRCVQVGHCPGIREIRWRNMHVPQVLVETRKWWANILLSGGLLAWSFIVAAIRSVDNFSEIFRVPTEFLKVLFDVYLPAMVVEGLVRIIPFLVKGVAIWIRFKAASDIDHYVVRWYFVFRLVTFIFVILGGTIVDGGDAFVDDPKGFLKQMSTNIVANSQFFISYVMVAGGIQVFFRLSQLHNVFLYWLTTKTRKEEAISQRRLDEIRSSVKMFHLDEFVPLFLFIFMVGAVYGSLAPLSCLIVAAFFGSAHRVFRFLALFVYGNNYEGGGFIFYTLNNVLFYSLYIVIVMIASYLAQEESPIKSGLFLLFLFVVALVHGEIHRTFVTTSRSLSLTKAQYSDQYRDHITVRDRKAEEFLRAKAALEEHDDCDTESGSTGSVRNVEKQLTSDLKKRGEEPSADPTADSEHVRQALSRMEKRYEEADSFSEVTCSEASGPQSDFFIFRQPSLNRVTWEVGPRPYRDAGLLREAEL